MRWTRLRPKNQKFVIQGARQHKLKNISLEIPHSTLTVVTGPSGSGKS
jgi:excinuclease ABC subunit A